MNKKNRLKNVFYYFGGTAITAILGLFSSPFLTRVLSQEVYAQYGMVITFCTAVATFIYLGQDDVFMRFFDTRKDSFRRWLFRCVRFPIVLCTIIVLFLIEPSATLMQYVFGKNISAMAVMLICMYLVVTVIQRFLMLTARMEERALNYSISNIATKAVFLAAVWGIYLFWNDISFEYIIFSLTLGVLVAMFINILVVIRVNHKTVERGQIVTTKAMLEYGLPLAITTTLAFTIPLIEKLVIRRGTSWEVLAVYTSASIFITVMGMVKTTVNNIWVPYAYKTYENEDNFKNIYSNIGNAMAFLLVGIIAGTILTRRWLVLIMDSSYFEAYLIAPAIVCGACYDVLAALYNIGIFLSKKTQYRITIPLVRFATSMVVLVVGLPTLGLKATGLSYVLSIGISCTLEILISRHYYNARDSYKKMFPLIGIATLASIIALFANSLLFDVVCCVILVVLDFAVMHKEVFWTIKWVRAR